MSLKHDRLYSFLKIIEIRLFLPFFRKINVPKADSSYQKGSIAANVIVGKGSGSGLGVDDGGIAPYPKGIYCSFTTTGA